MKHQQREEAVIKSTSEHSAFLSDILEYGFHDKSLLTVWLWREREVSFSYITHQKVERIAGELQTAVFEDEREKKVPNGNLLTQRNDNEIIILSRIK